MILLTFTRFSFGGRRSRVAQGDAIQATGCKSIHNRDIPHQLFAQFPSNHGNTVWAFPISSVQSMRFEHQRQIGTPQRLLYERIERAVDVRTDSICANMQFVTEIEVKWLEKMRSNQCFQITSVFNLQCFWPSDMPLFPLVPRDPLGTFSFASC